MLDAPPPRPTTALIFGVGGQDGAYLAQRLLETGCRVHGTSRDAQLNSFGPLRRLGLLDRVERHSVTLTDFRSVLQVMSRVQPDEVYNLAGQSAVGLSFQQPVETLDSIASATLNVLEVIRFLGRPVRFYNACSSECFGDTGDTPAHENSPFRPRSPYAVAKAAAFWQVAMYREAYGLYACSGLLANHESPLRPERFVTQKIVAAACRIAAGRQQRLELGNVEIARDWGWAPEYVEAMRLMLQQPQAEDFVVATGVTSTLQELVAAAFAAVGLDWREHVTTNPELRRPYDIPVVRLDPSKARRVLGWSARTFMPEVVRRMVEAFRESPEARS